jgi:hypothetical protein
MTPVMSCDFESLAAGWLVAWCASSDVEVAGALMLLTRQRDIMAQDQTHL